MVVLAVREGNVPWGVALRMPLPRLVDLCKKITKAVYQEQYEWAWANFVSSQCDQKAMKDLTKPWARIAGLRGASGGGKGDGLVKPKTARK